jgi:2'-hydroxyisoflavone reductase
MKLLILGGTLFLGRHLVDAALDAGHAVTTFTRGHTAAHRDVEALHGNRDGDLAALDGRTWDAVIDTSGYVPRVVRASAERLAGTAGHYTFVSSISAYARFDAGPIREDAPLGELEDPGSEDVDAHYGELKAACERVAAEAFAGRALIVRPGLIVGPHDPTERFTYWVRRLAEGGEVLAPGDPERRVQLIDARDLARWLVDMAARGATGTYNATGPHPRPTMRELLEAASPDGARLTWVPDEFLLAHGVGEWQELPLWIADPSLRAFLDADVSAAVAAGLTFRPLAETARDTLAWARAASPGTPGRLPAPPAGMAREREAELLAAWHAGAG